MVKYLNQNLGVKTTIKRLYKTKETKNKRKDGKLEVRIIGARMYLLSNLTNGPIICEPKLYLIEFCYRRSSENCKSSSQA